MPLLWEFACKRTNLQDLQTGSICRSQMVEGWARHMQAGVFAAYSAGVMPHGVDPRAIIVKAEAGIGSCFETFTGHKSEKNLG